MQSAEIDNVELKSVAKAIGASLKRSGHPVPHTAVLNAVASALNQRNWNTLRTKLSATSAMPSRAGSPLAEAAPVAMPAYGRGTRFLLRLVQLKGLPLPDQPLPDEPARAWALAQLQDELSGVLSWGGWNVPATLQLSTSELDADDFAPEHSPALGFFVARPTAQLTLSLQCSYQTGRGWTLNKAGAEYALSFLEEALPEPELEAALRSAWSGSSQTPRLPGKVVPAVVHTDDDAMTVEFDARGFLAQATREQLLDLLESQLKSGEATDAVADWESTLGRNEALREVQTYLEVLQKNPRCTTGFTCSVESVPLLEWLVHNRSELLALVLCDYFEVSLAQAQEEEIAGMWDWLHGSEGCDFSHDSETAAALDAVAQLQLLQRLQNEMRTWR